MAKKKPTRDDVAKLAGTSTAVVSYVINGGPRPVAPATRDRVLKAIAETGYRPNSLARSLAHGSTDIFALLVTDMANPFLAQLSQALEREFFAAGKTLLIGDSGDDTDREIELLETFMRQQVSGLVWYGVDQPLPVDAIKEYPYPTVLINQPEGFPIADHEAMRARVDIRESEESFLATDHLASHGRRSIAIVAGPKGRLNSRERIRGWRMALDQHGLEYGPLINAPFTREGGQQSANLIIDSDADGVVASNEMQAMGLLSAFAKSGVRVPQDIAVFAINGTPSAEFMVPSLSAVHLPLKKMAKDVKDALIKQQRTEVINVVPNLELRHSCGC